MAGSADPGPSFVWWAVEALTAALTAVVTFIAVRLHNRVDALEKQAVEDAKVLVTREELQATVTTQTEERRRMHAENQQLLRDIFGKLDDHSELKEKVRRAEADIQDLDNKIERVSLRQGPVPHT